MNLIKKLFHHLKGERKLTRFKRLGEDEWTVVDHYMFGHLSITDIEIGSKRSVMFCPYNNIKLIQCPKQLTTLYCYYNKLHSLIFNKSIKEVYCYNNEIRFLNLPKSLRLICCHNNLIKRLKITKMLYFLVISNTKLEGFSKRNDLIIHIKC